MDSKNIKNKLAIGSAQFGLDYGISNKNGKIKKYEIDKILNFAWTNGIDTIDTPSSYGMSESAIGNYLKRNNKKEWKIITKISDIENYDINYQIKSSINNLKVVPYAILGHSLDIYLDDKFQNKILKVKENNKIKKIGVSVYDKTEIEKVLGAKVKPDVIQIPINVLDTRLYNDGILQQLKNHLICLLKLK